MVSATCVDSGAFTSTVYSFCLPRWGRHVFATKGKGGSDLPIVYRRSRRKKDPERCPLFTIGADAAKELFFGRLKLEPPGPSTVHYHTRLGTEFFLQVTAEVRKVTYSAGRERYTYEKIRDRNEALDLEVLCLAALRIEKPTLVGVVRPPPAQRKSQLELPTLEVEETPDANAQPGQRLPSRGRGRWTVK